MNAGILDLRPGKLWGLWDMLRVSATAYLKLGRRIEEGRMILLMNKSLNVVWSDEEKSRMRQTMKAIHKHASTLKLETTEEAFAEWLKHDNLPQTTREWDYMTDIVTKELSRKLFLFVPSHVARYYEYQDILSEDARAAFPNAYKELVEAGNCLAAGRFVASVFHSMLAAEIGVRAFANELKVVTPGPVELTDWQPLLNGMTGRIREIENQPKTAQRDEDLAFFSEGAAQFRFFKNGWRMPNAHGRGFFDEPGAIEAIDHVRSFFEVIAKRLKE
jgi:hypothetical protein